MSKVRTDPYTKDISKGIWLDKGEFPRGKPTINANQSTWVEFYDAPHVQLSDDYIETSEDINFDNYLMFRPNGGIWVPLRLINWVVNDSADHNADGTWTAKGSATIKSDEDTSAFPHWTDTY